MQLQIRFKKLANGLIQATVELCTDGCGYPTSRILNEAGKIIPLHLYDTDSFSKYNLNFCELVDTSDEIGVVVDQFIGQLEAFLKCWRSIECPPNIDYVL